MTRKRFIKLLMAEGISRNDARFHAAWVASENIKNCNLNHIGKIQGFPGRCGYLSFQKAYENHNYCKNHLKEFIRILREEV